MKLIKDFKKLIFMSNFFQNIDISKYWIWYNYLWDKTFKTYKLFFI